MAQIELLTFSMRKTEPKAGEDWFRIVKDKVEDVTHVYIYDEIGYWGTNAKDFAAQVADVSTAETHFHFNSPGGSVFDGLAISATIKAMESKTIGKVEGMAASAASFILQACDEREITRNASVMVHDASGYAGGNAAQMRKSADLLDRISDNIADIYAVRSGQGTMESWRETMKAGDEWYDGNEALASGLVDRVIDNPAEDEGDADNKTWVQDEVQAFLMMPAAMLAQDPKRSVITNRVEEALMSGTNPQNPSNPPAAKQPPAKVNPTGPEAPSPVAGLVAVNVGGVEMMVAPEVKAHMDQLSAFQTETIEGARKDFITELASKNVIPATEIDNAEELALSMSSDQFSKWKALMNAAPALPLLGNHGTDLNAQQSPDNGGAQDEEAQEIVNLEAIVKSHRDAGTPQSKIETKASWKRLQELKSKKPSNS